MRNLHLFEIVGGDNDLMSGPATPEFESQLRALNIQQSIVRSGAHQEDPVALLAPERKNAALAADPPLIERFSLCQILRKVTKNSSLFRSMV
jgi:hypothetical protein